MSSISGLFLFTDNNYIVKPYSECCADDIMLNLGINDTVHASTAVISNLRSTMAS